MKIKINNPDLSSAERTYITTDYSSGVSLTVRNNDGFTTDWYVVVGEPGQEQTETQLIAGSSGNETITLNAALKFSHPKSTPVYLAQWNKWSFERKATGGSFAEISSSPLDIKWDDHEKGTMVVVSGGLTTDTYRWRVYSAQAGTYGTYADDLPGTGLARDIAGSALQAVKRNHVAKYIKDDIIYEFFSDFQELVYEEIPKAWWFTKEGTAVATIANTYKYSISDNWSDFLSMKYMLYNFVSGSTDINYSLTWSPTSEFYNFKSDTNQSDDDNAKYWTILPPDDDSAKGYIALHPTPKTAVCFLKPAYFQELTKIDSYGDTLIIPKTKGYVDYALYRIYDEIKSDTANADKYNTRIRASIIALKRRFSRQKGQQELTRFRGQRGWSRLFGEQSRLNSSEATENYW